MQILFIGHVTGDTKERESALDRSMMVSIEGLECFESEFNASLSGPSRKRGKFIVSSLYLLTINLRNQSDTRSDSLCR